MVIEFVHHDDGGWWWRDSGGREYGGGFVDRVRHRVIKAGPQPCETVQFHLQGPRFRVPLMVDGACAALFEHGDPGRGGRRHGDIGGIGRTQRG